MHIETKFLLNLEMQTLKRGQQKGRLTRYKKAKHPLSII